MKKQTLILLILIVLTTSLVACQSEPATPTPEVKTLTVEEWPTPIMATAIPTATPFPKPDGVTISNNPAITTENSSAEVTSDTTTNKSKLPPRVMQIIMQELEADKIKALMKEVALGADAVTILGQLEPDERQRIIDRLDFNDVRELVEQLEPDEQQAVIDLLGLDISMPAPADTSSASAEETTTETVDGAETTTAESATPIQLPDNVDQEVMLALLSEADAETLFNQVNATVEENILTLVGTSVIQKDGIPQHTGPGTNYASMGTLDVGSIAGIFGQDSSGGWVYVISPKNGFGWIPVADLWLVGDSSVYPVLPPNPRPNQSAVANVFGGSPKSSDNASTSATSNTSTRVTTVTDMAAIADMETVTTAKPTNQVNMRQGPGAAYGLIDSLSTDTGLEILAQNKPQDWLLVKTDTGQIGWISKGLLTLDGSTADAPVILSARPGAVIPAGEIAPVAGMAGTTDTTSTSSSTSTSQSSSLGISLAPVATANISQRETTMRLGPASSYGQLTELNNTDETLNILAVDANGQWVLVQRTAFEEPKLGWMVLNDLTVSGSIASVPQVLTSWVVGNGVEVREGPGISHPSAGQLGNDALVLLLGLHEGRNWALVQPVAGGNPVWIMRTFLAANSSLMAQIPELSAPAVPVADTSTSLRGEQRITPQGTLVFQRSSGDDIMVINADGSSLRTLTKGIDPMLSPDGQQVAFTRWQGNNGSVWTINIDGTNERQVVDGIIKPKGADWSPDGSMLVINYEANYKGERRECLSLAKGARRPPGGSNDFEVKVNDKGIPFICWTLPPSALWNLKLVNLADGATQDFDGGSFAFRPTWDPTNNLRIVSSGGGGLVDTQLDTNNVDNSQQVLLTDLVKDRVPVFSPDGQYLAVEHGSMSGGGRDLYRLNSDGNGRVRLTQTPMFVITDPDSDGKTWDNVAPAWSPDGQLVAFVTNREGSWQVWVMNVDGSDPRPMFSDEIQAKLDIQYNYVDERVISWR
ncbi:SH3 domain-containing protein [Anaerolineales bacterium HSG6]|nr:SH3 domain-containing protein [Anaerolineales bacterium HSG6]